MLAGEMWRRLLLLLARGVLRGVDDSKALQLIAADLLDDEVKSNIERPGFYGFTSHPLPGMPVIVGFMGGNRTHGVVLAVGDREFRLKNLAAGEVALYTDEGDYIHFQRGSKIAVLAGAEIEATAPLVTVKAATRVRMETPLLEVTGEIRDRCESGGLSMAEMRDAYNAHTHPGDSGGVTGLPNTLME